MDKNRAIWHPFTNMKTSPEPVKVKSGDGIWLELESGQKIMDLISSWWVNLHGHAHPEIAGAIARQAEVLEHVIFAGYTHQPAEDLAQKLLTVLPENITKIFYSDNGSTAVEVALKMAVQYWQNLGHKNRTRFIAFNGAYHGDTFGAMSAGSRSVFSNPFNELLFGVDYFDYPSTWLGDSVIKQKEQRELDKIELLLQKRASQYAAIILEPLVQGAGGMNMCRPQFLRELEKLAKAYDVLLIYDEVMTGFGRTGDWFAAGVSQTQPDIICMSKGITGGFLPLSVTAASQKIFDAFYDEKPAKTLYHGHSYTANPLGCAAAVASFGLTKKAMSGIEGFPNRYRNFITELKSHPKVEKIRNTGTVLAFDVKTREESGYLNSVAQKIKEESLKRNLLIRPLGNTVYLMPPYIITDEQLEQAFSGILETLKVV